MKSWNDWFERRAAKRKRNRLRAEDYERREKLRALAEAGGLEPRHHYLGL